MKALITIATLLLVGTVATLAQTNKSEASLTMPVNYSTDWKPYPGWYQSVLSQKATAPRLTIGRREFLIQGPLVETFRPPKTTPADDLLDSKLRRVPILSLVVPLRMPMPPETKTKYFRWKGENSQPWHAITQVAPAGASGDNRIHVRPSGSLISVNF